MIITKIIIIKEKVGARMSDDTPRHRCVMDAE